MKTLSRSEIPSDFSYYRTGSRVFFHYYEQVRKSVQIIRITSGYEFLRIQRLFGFSIIIAEKIDIEPSIHQIQSLKKQSKHGVIFWAPFRRIEKPLGWYRLPTWFIKDFLHSSRSAFSILDRADYWNKWSSRARYDRRKVLQMKESHTIKIIQTSDSSQWLEIYKKTKVSDPNKAYLVQWCQKIFSQSLPSLRLYLIFVNEIPLAGALFIDEGVTSEYTIAFYHQDSRPYHLSTAMMDQWFSDSYEMGMKYCDLDHMQDAGQSSGYAGYTKFKESIADFDVYFHDCWIRFF